MADIFTKSKRSEIMSHIRGKHTAPEMLVRRELFSLGFRYRLHVKDLPGKPDLVFPKYGCVLIVDGCFWHGHQNCKVFRLPKTRVAFWKNKIETNRKRDTRNKRSLRKLGWRVVHVWECQLSAKRLPKTVDRIVNEIKTGSM
mgnify:FL=1